MKAIDKYRCERLKEACHFYWTKFSKRSVLMFHEADLYYLCGIRKKFLDDCSIGKLNVKVSSNMAELIDLSFKNKLSLKMIQTRSQDGLPVIPDVGYIKNTQRQDY